MLQSKYVKGSIIMETQKKHIEFHINIDEAADRLNVQIVAEKPTVGEMLTCLLGTVKCVATTVAENRSEDTQKTLHSFANMVLKLADEMQDEEDNR